MIYNLRYFPLQNAVCFIILTYLVPVLFTFYIQGVLKLKKSSAKMLIIIKKFSIITVASTCFGLHKPSSGSYSLCLAETTFLVPVYLSLLLCSVSWPHMRLSTDCSSLMMVYVKRNMLEHLLQF